MTELAFAKSFLAALDSRPSKLPAEHVEDPKNHPPRSAYILPKNALPLPKRQRLAPGSERSLSVSLRSLRNPPLDITLSSQPPNTSILDLKEAIHRQTAIPVDKIRVLHKKKPVPDSRVLKELAGEDDQRLEFGVMVIGGAAVLRAGEEEVIPPVAQSGGEVLSGEKFWEDLRAFLVQRVRDEEVGGKAYEVFRKAWEEKR